VPLLAALDLAALRSDRFRPRTARPETARPGWSTRRREVPRGAFVVALATAAILLVLTTSATHGATTETPKCDDVRLRTGPSTAHPRKTNVDEGDRVTVVATVDGAAYGVRCAGSYRSGDNWHRISAVNGRSVSSLYGVKYVYGAAKLFKTLTNPTPAPTTAPTPTAFVAVPTASATSAPTAAPTAMPTTGPTTVPTTAPTADPNPSAAPTSTPTTAPTAAPTAPPYTPPWPTGPITLPQSVTFFGRGWGHGVGLSQYGAHGRALDGQPAATILAHYYKGTVLGTMADRQVRVLVLASFPATSSNPAQVYGRGGTWSIDGIAATFPADARLKFQPTTSSGTVTWTATVTAPDGTTLHSGTTGPRIRVRPAAGTTLQLWSRPSAYDRYRGVLRLIGGTGPSTTVNVVNELPMESYLRGVIPAEISASWPIESIKAQTIAARSYAAYRLHPDTGTFDFFDDTRSQVYLGKLAEKAATDAAIAATAGVVVRTSAGAIANAMFHSTGGGSTEHNENVFVSSTGGKIAGVVSYLRGSMDRRPDGTAYDAAGPHARWKTTTYTLAQLQAWYGSDSRTNVGTLVAVDLDHRGVSGRLISVTLIGANGTTKKVSGDVFRSVLNAHKPAPDPLFRSNLFALSPIP
jgi:stage II sporulation protein D